MPTGNASTSNAPMVAAHACGRCPCWQPIALAESKCHPLRVGDGATPCSIAVGGCPHIPQPSRPLQGALVVAAPHPQATLPLLSIATTNA
ncbi:hypothetical protein BHE74_00054482 [Ensete ventricosum]|nr:hypothetical protein BHE74_00054482 [Ensete ventricosum]